MDIKHFDYLPDDARKLRTEVFIEEQGFREEFDDDDGTATHFVGYIDGLPVATCRVISKTDGYVIGRVAVSREFRAGGLGSQIINAAEKLILSGGGGKIYIHAQKQAARFYERLGYLPTGEADFDEGCPHCMMLKRI